jgi:hypothetical protein
MLVPFQMPLGSGHGFHNLFCLFEQHCLLKHSEIFLVDLTTANQGADLWLDLALAAASASSKQTTTL